MLDRQLSCLGTDTAIMKIIPDTLRIYVFFLIYFCATPGDYNMTAL
jgi:hypothetical protein